MMNRFFTLLLAASCLTAVGQIDYVPDSVLIDEGWSLVLEREGRQYWLFDEDREWEDARAMCEELGAYLYWPNSLEEHLDVWASVPSGDDGIHYWTAVHQDFNIVDCSDPHGGWAGPDEVPQQFFHWSAENPNNATGRESVVQFEYGDWGALWNDAPGQACDDGFNCTCRFSRVILERSDNLGCSDPLACNFEGQSLFEDGSCDYSCCPGPGCCYDGTTWDYNLEQCVPSNSADINNDGCVQLNDLLDVLSAYGDCDAEEAPWQCGNPLEYQGYNYETVQIGEQCWFATDLQSTVFRDSSSISEIIDNDAWSATSSPARLQIASCLNDQESDLHASMLYNGYCIRDERGLCPTGWGVPSDGDWQELEVFLGMDAGVAAQSSEAGVGRGTNQGQQLKATPDALPNWNGTNDWGFNAVIGGSRSTNGSHVQDCTRANFWTSSQHNDRRNFERRLTSVYDGIGRQHSDIQEGWSVRCIKDTE